MLYFLMSAESSFKCKLQLGEMWYHKIIMYDIRIIDAISYVISEHSTDIGIQEILWHCASSFSIVAAILPGSLDFLLSKLNQVTISCNNLNFEGSQRSVHTPSKAQGVPLSNDQPELRSTATRCNNCWHSKLYAQEPHAARWKLSWQSWLCRITKYLQRDRRLAWQCDQNDFTQHVHD